MANTNKQTKVAPWRILLIVIAVILVVAIAAGVFLVIWMRQNSQTRSNLGNNGGNLANGGTALDRGDNIYLTDLASGNLMQVSAGQVAGPIVMTAKPTYLNTDGKSVWYVERDTGALVCTDISGGNPVTVVPSGVTRLTYSRGYLYFVDADSNYALSRISAAGGSSVELLSAARVMQYAIVGDKIFYCDLNDSDACCYMNLDGSDATTLSFRVGQVLVGQGPRLFYSNPDRDGALDFYELGKDGNFYGPTSLDTGTVTCAVSTGDRLYYTSAADGKLYWLDLKQAANGAQPQLAVDAPVYGLQAAGGYIYYQNVADHQWGAVAVS